MFRLIGILFVIASISWAQESRGTIAGMVLDAHGAVVPGASVVVTNIATGVSVTLQTNERGAYSAPLLLPGTYRVAAEHTGFKKSTRDGIALSINDSLQIDIALQLGAISESVEVSDAAPLVES